MATNLYSDGTSCGSVKADDSRRLCDISRCPGRTEWRGSEDLDVCDGGGTHESGRANSWPSWLSRYNLYGCADGVSGSTNRPRIEAEATWPSSDRQDDYPIQDRRVGQRALPIQIASEVPKYTVIGDAHLKIFKLSLPRHYHSLLRFILQGCISHAEKSSCGWMTYLYSLTKQDIALRDVQGLYEASRPIIHYIKSTIEQLYGVDAVRIDRNQPHVLKYEDKHKGVTLHHDKCDITANIMLSRPSEYEGGGTYFSEIDQTVRLDFGELLVGRVRIEIEGRPNSSYSLSFAYYENLSPKLHPGRLVHSGVDITSGSRYLMIMFVHK